MIGEWIGHAKWVRSEVSTTDNTIFHHPLNSLIWITTLFATKIYSALIKWKDSFFYEFSIHFIYKIHFKKFTRLLNKTYSPFPEHAKMSSSETIKLGLSFWCGDLPSSARRMHNRSVIIPPVETAQQLPHADWSRIVPIICAHWGHFSRASKCFGIVPSAICFGWAPVFPNVLYMASRRTPKIEFHSIFKCLFRF